MRIIVNPVAGNGRGARVWPQVQKVLEGEGVTHNAVFTEGPEHAVDLARQAVEEGIRLLVSVGGDGTIHEVVNGLVDEGSVAEGVVLGIVSCGTGSDFARTVGLEIDPVAAARRLVQGSDRSVDLGEIRCMREGREILEYFPNAAGIGFDGEAAEWTNRMPKIIGGTVPYLMGLLLTLITYRNKPVKLVLDDRSLELKIVFVVAANGGYFGGGMHIAPDCEPDDGLFDVVVAGDVGKLDFLRTVPRVYNGTHLSHPKVDVYRSSTLRVESSERMLLQADGELVGEAPASFRLLPGALTVRV